jgi:glycosyltransferase involved in cell wall biosynthesis
MGLEKEDMKQSMTEKPYARMTKKKVVFLARFFYPHIGGVETHVLQLALQLQKRGYHITVITEQFDSKLPRAQEKLGVRIIRIPQSLCGSKRKVWTWMLQHKTLFQSAQIVHAHDVAWWYWPFSILFHIPFFTTFHGYEGVNTPTLGKILSRKFSEMTSQATICVGDWMKKWYHANPSFVTYGAAACKPSKLDQKKNTAVFIGRLSEDTGILEYMRATIMAKGTWKLDVFGAGPLEEEVKKLAAKHKRNISFHGETKNPVLEIKKHRWAFVSRYLSIIEAQQIGRFVFAHWNNEIKRDYLTALPTIQQIQTFHSAEQLAKKIQQIKKQSRKEREQIQKAQTWASLQTWKKIADMYEVLWNA